MRMPDSQDGRLSSSRTSQTSSKNSNHTFFLNNASKKWAKRYRTEISASSASLLSTLAAYPLDSVKTRMQAYKFSTFQDCVMHTFRTEGVHGFWRGVAAPLASITLVRTVSFSIYQRAKYTYDEWIYRARGKSPLMIANTKGAWPSLETVACFGAAGATSGALITAISCMSSGVLILLGLFALTNHLPAPFELTKLNAQIAVLMEKGGKEGEMPKSQKPMGGGGTLATVKTIIKHRGILGMYSGFHLHLLRDTIGTSIYFMTYESSKQILANARGRSPTSPLPVVIAGGLCGLVSWACIYPIDSAKSIYQRNILSSGTEKPEPIKIKFFSRRMYRGLSVSMTRSCLINALFFSIFELVKKHINKLELDG